MKAIALRLGRSRMLVALNVLYAATGILWLSLIPYNNAPDENTHFHYSVEFIIQHHRLPVWGVDDLDRFRHALSSYNQMPALNYGLYAIGAAAAKKLFGLEEYLGARLVALAWGLVFLNFLFLAAKTAGGDAKNALLVTAAIALIPQILFAFCYVNSDAHSLAIAAILGYALARFLRAQAMIKSGGKAATLFCSNGRAGQPYPADITRPHRPCGPVFFKFLDQNIIFLGAAIGLLFSAKYNYYIYFPCVAAIVFWAALQRRLAWKTAGKLILVSGVLSLLISGFWFIRNALLYGSPLPILMSEDFFKSIALARTVHPVDHGVSLASLAWLVRQGFISSTFDSFFAVFGYLNVGFARWVYTILEIAVPALAVFFSIAVFSRRDRAARLALLALLAMVAAVMAMHAWACLTFDYQAQGRYNFPILVPVAVFASWAITRFAALKKYALIFLVLMAALFIGANLLIIRAYASPVQFSVAPVDQAGAQPAWHIAARTMKNYYATGKITIDHAPLTGIKVGLSDRFLARYRDFCVELETEGGSRAVDFSAAAPEQLRNAGFDAGLNAVEATGRPAGFILPLPESSRVKSLKITCRIENRRRDDPE